MLKEAHKDDILTLPMENGEPVRDTAVCELRALRQEVRGLRNDLRSYAKRARQKTSFSWTPEEQLPEIPDL